MPASHPKFPIVLSIAAALITLAMKGTAYWVTDSVGLLSDAAESLVNLTAALIAFFCLWFAARPVGAVVIGLYADRAGRRPAMLLSFALMGGAITVLAMTPSYAAIGVAAPIIAILARLVQGFALGGEASSATAYLLELSPVHRRGFSAALQGASQNVAAAIGASMGLILAMLLPPDIAGDYAWRIALLYGVLYALLQLEQTALVLGALLLFAVIAALMVATRRIDWYALAAHLRAPA